MRPSIHTPLLLLLTKLLTHPLQAKTTYAVIIGISDYALFGPHNGDLRFADADARLFASLLQARAGGSVYQKNIILLTNRQATRHNVLNAMTLFERAAWRHRIIFLCGP